MHRLRFPPSLRRVQSIVSLALASLCPLATAQPAGGGTIEGRVANVTSRSFLNNARVTAEGTGVTAFTNEFGEYRLAGLPAGTVRVTAFFTGLESQTITVALAPGAVAKLDFELTRGAKSDAGETVRLGEFVVAAERDMNAASIAINEQRFASNIMNVVSADAFGDSTEGNIAEFVKYLPGVVVDITGYDARGISVRGLGSETTPITADGAQVASAASSGTGRNVETTSLALNNIARIEVSKSPTPDSRADTLGGSVNVVSKNAFERRKPLFAYSVYLNGKDDSLGLHRYPAPQPAVAGYRVRPSYSLSYIAPVNRNFGFTLSASGTDRWTESEFLRTAWAPAGFPTTAATVDNPALRQFFVQTQPSRVVRTSYSGGFDWKLSPVDVVSFNAQYFYGWFEQIISNLTWDSSTPASYGPTFTNGSATGGTATFSLNQRHKVDATVLGSLRYRHTGPVWRVEGSASYSRSYNVYDDEAEGYFGNTTWRLSGLNVNFRDVNGSQPVRVETFSGGQPINSHDAANARVISTSNGNSKDSADVVTAAALSVQRDLGWRVPFLVKTGFNVRRQDRDIREVIPTWTFVGPDRVANTADDTVSRYDLIDDSGYNREAAAFKQPLINWPSSSKLYQLYRAHPEYFTESSTARITSMANGSRKITETVSAAFLRLDLKLLENRLHLVGGGRLERTDDDGYGVLNDIRATYQQDANGNLIRDAAGRPIRVSTDAVQIARLQYTDRGAHVKRHYQNFCPSFNASYTFRENLVARVAYAKTIGRPTFGRIIPGVTVSDPGATTGTPTISLNNTGLKPWTGDNYDLSVERYFEPGGVLSFGVFQKDIKNFFGSVRSAATLEQLEGFGLNDDYLGYDIVTTTNVGDARIQGYEFNFRQSLRFLPKWARGVQVFVNGTDIHLAGSTIADFNAFVRRTLNWGVGLSRPRFTTNINWNFRGRQRNGAITGANVPAGTYAYIAPRLTLDVSAEYRVRPGVTIFATGRNLANEPQLEQRYSATTAYYGRGFGETNTGAFFTLGVKGEF